jgi:hypothetical protein
MESGRVVVHVPRSRWCCVSASRRRQRAGKQQGGGGRGSGGGWGRGVQEKGEAAGPGRGQVRAGKPAGSGGSAETRCGGLRAKNERLRRLSFHGAAEKIDYEPRSPGPADSVTWACAIEDVRGGSGEESAARCRRFFSRLESTPAHQRGEAEDPMEPRRARQPCPLLGWDGTSSPVRSDCETSFRV